MSSLAELYGEMSSADAYMGKEAGEQDVGDIATDDDTMKVAQEYDASGRALAHALFADLAGEAEMEETGPSYEEKVAAVKHRMLNDPEYAAAVVAKFSQTR